MSRNGYDSTVRPHHGSSDFERFTEERKRYARAKQEARMLKKLAGGGDLGPEGSHPWLWAIHKAKSQGVEPENADNSEASEKRKLAGSPDSRRLWLVGAAFVACITLAAYGVVRLTTGSPRESAILAQTRPTIHVWHALDGPELAYLIQLAAAFAPGQIDVVISRQDHVESAVRQSLFHGDFPDVVILSEAEARSLAQLGILEPLTDDSGRGRLYLPLVEPGPWTTALVAAIVGHGDDPIAQRARERFVFQLRENLHRDHQP